MLCEEEEQKEEEEEIFIVTQLQHSEMCPLRLTLPNSRSSVRRPGINYSCRMAPWSKAPSGDLYCMLGELERLALPLPGTEPRTFLL